MEMKQTQSILRTMCACVCYLTTPGSPSNSTPVNHVSDR